MERKQDQSVSRNDVCWQVLRLYRLGLPVEVIALKMGVDKDRVAAEIRRAILARVRDPLASAG